jgi:hypothetical protein
MFLNITLSDEMYMSQPKGFVTHGQENKICKTSKALYGLWQAP